MLHTNCTAGPNTCICLAGGTLICFSRVTFLFLLCLSKSFPALGNLVQPSTKLSSPDRYCEFGRVASGWVWGGNYNDIYPTCSLTTIETGPFRVTAQTSTQRNKGEICNLLFVIPMKALIVIFIWHSLAARCQSTHWKLPTSEGFGNHCSTDWIQISYASIK